jgi:hypothetical protein
MTIMANRSDVQSEVTGIVNSSLNLAQHRARRPDPRMQLIRPVASLALIGAIGWMLARLGRRWPVGWLLGTVGGWLLARAARGIARPLEHRAVPAAGRDPVAQSSEASFPASDPPSWSPTRAGAPL